MLTSLNDLSRAREALRLKSSQSQGQVSDTWPPHVFDAVVELLAEVLVQEYQSMHATASATDLTLLRVQGHRPIPKEAVEA